VLIELIDQWYVLLGVMIISIQYAIMLRDGMGGLVSHHDEGQKLLNIVAVSLLREAYKGVPRAIHSWALLLNHNFITLPSTISRTTRQAEVTRLWAMCSWMGNATSQRHLALTLRFQSSDQSLYWRLQSAKQVSDIL
jgi:hypothetical protein